MTKAQIIAVLIAIVVVLAIVAGFVLLNPSMIVSAGGSDNAKVTNTGSVYYVQTTDSNSNSYSDLGGVYYETTGVTSGCSSCDKRGIPQIYYTTHLNEQYQQCWRKVAVNNCCNTPTVASGCNNCDKSGIPQIYYTTHLNEQYVSCWTKSNVPNCCDDGGSVYTGCPPWN